MINRHVHRACSWTLRNLVPEAYWPDSVDVDGVPIRLRNTPYSFSVRRLIKNGQYELPERTLVKRAITPGMQVVEFGGSIGIVTSVVAKCAGPTGRVVSVEASPQLTDFSRTWLERSGNVTVLTGYAFPVWQTPRGLHVDGFSGSNVSLGGRVSFNVADASTPDSNGASPSSRASNGASHSAPPASAHGPAAQASSPHTPRNYDLSTICAEFELKPDALVMDIEAAERIVLDQPPSYPASLKAIIAEFHPHLYPNGQQDLDAILATYAREGFEVKDQVHNTWLLQR